MKLTLYLFHISQNSRIKPLPNWPDSNKIKQLYGGNAMQGDEMILGSAVLSKVKIYAVSSVKKRVVTNRHGTYSSFVQGTPSIQGGFFGGSKVCTITRYAHTAYASGQRSDARRQSIYPLNTGRYPLVGGRIFPALQ